MFLEIFKFSFLEIDHNHFLWIAHFRQSIELVIGNPQILKIVEIRDDVINILFSYFDLIYSIDNQLLDLAISCIHLITIKLFIQNRF